MTVFIEHLLYAGQYADPFPLVISFTLHNLMREKLSYFIKSKTQFIVRYNPTTDMLKCEKMCALVNEICNYYYHPHLQLRKQSSRG